MKSKQKKSYQLIFLKSETLKYFDAALDTVLKPVF